MEAKRMEASQSQTITKEQSVRLNVQLPLELKESLDHWATQLHTTTPQLVQDFLRQGVEILNQQNLDQQLIAGYRYLAKENRQLLEEFRAVDRESWETDNADDA
jgi:hypothetical protein